MAFEKAGDGANVHYVSGSELGQLLHDTGVPVFILDACQTAMHEATAKPAAAVECGRN